MIFQCIFKIFQIMGGYIVLELPPVTSIVWEVMPDSLQALQIKNPKLTQPRVTQIQP